jgi:cell division protein FtsB
MRYVTLALLLLTVLVQGEIWLGKSGVTKVMNLRGQLADQQAVNAAARARNDQLIAEVRDLRDGLEMVEEKARFELGMVKPDEILVQYTRPIAAPRP